MASLATLAAIRRVETLAAYLTTLSVTFPVWLIPIARAAAGDKSICRPRTKGPRSVICTVTHPL